MIAPTLPGSWTSSSSSTSGISPASAVSIDAARALAMATMPAGALTGLSAAITVLGNADRLGAGAEHAIDEVIGAGVDGALGEGDSLEGDAGVERLFEQMLAVEQDQFRRAATARQIAEARDERILPARDAAHRDPIIGARSAGPCYHLTEMKARILKKFEDEIHKLDRELKAELPKEIQRARELGDLRENAEYHAAKERQRFVEARISLLQRRVSDIMLMNLDKLPKDRVGFGSTVHLKDPAGQVITYQLVMPEDADVDQGLISTASPIGRALLNKEEGDEVSVTTPNGSKRFEVVRLLTIHDEDPGEPQPGA